MKTLTLLIIHHSQSGRTARMAEAVLRGAQHCDGVQVRLLRAFDTTPGDVLACDGLLIGTPENFGTMAGAIKDFFDRTYYACESRTRGLPYAIFVSAGNDGRGAVRDIVRIASGCRWQQKAEALIVRGGTQAEPGNMAGGALDDADIVRCEELGEAMAQGLALGLF